MKRFSLVCTVVMSSMLWFAGCSSPEDTSSSTEGSTPAATEDAGSTEGSTEGSDSKEGASTEGTEGVEEVAKLSPEDQKLVDAQKVCLVSGEDLGSMGSPVKVSVEGKDVFVCCSNCEAPLKKDPQKYLAKLEEKE